MSISLNRVYASTLINDDLTNRNDDNETIETAVNTIQTVYGLGVDQTWHDETENRAINVVYYITGKPIQLAVTLETTGSDSAYARIYSIVDGKETQICELNTPLTKQTFFPVLPVGSFIIRTTQTYLRDWKELY